VDESTDRSDGGTKRDAEEVWQSTLVDTGHVV